MPVIILIGFFSIVFGGENFDSKVKFCMKNDIQDSYCKDWLTQKEIEARK